MIKQIQDWWNNQWNFPDWGDYRNYCHFEEKKPTKLKFFWFKISGVIWFFTRHQIDILICKIRGHKIIDCSIAGPNSGNMDHECERCGKYWHIPLY